MCNIIIIFPQNYNYHLKHSLNVENEEGWNTRIYRYEWHGYEDTMMAEKYNLKRLFSVIYFVTFFSIK
jgi:hypothetical protein